MPVDGAEPPTPDKNLCISSWQTFSMVCGTSFKVHVFPMADSWCELAVCRWNPPGSGHLCPGLAEQLAELVRMVHRSSHLADRRRYHHVLRRLLWLRWCFEREHLSPENCKIFECFSTCVWMNECFCWSYTCNNEDESTVSINYNPFYFK